MSPYAIYNTQPNIHQGLKYEIIFRYGTVVVFTQTLSFAGMRYIIYMFAEEYCGLLLSCCNSG